MLRQIVYVSSSTCPAADIDIDSILMTARRNNQNLGITGMLISIDRTFFQVLEGPEPAVRTLYNRIAIDSRHKNMLPLLDQPVPDRQFAAWKMAWANLPADHPMAPQVLRFTGEADMHAVRDALDPKMLILLKTFMRNNGSDEIH